MYSVKMFLEYVDSHTTLKMQCSLSHSLVQYLTFKNVILLYTPLTCIFFFFNSLIFIIFLCEKMHLDLYQNCQVLG